MQSGRLLRQPSATVIRKKKSTLFFERGKKKKV
jgi:hypothetical protein